MKGTRGRYKTRQQALIEECLKSHGDRYLTVDGVLDALAASGERVGRSTAYRRLESMVEAGEALKAVGANGECSYRIAPDQPSGQLVCLDCGRALPLDCHMLDDFTDHVQSHHGFVIENSRSVLFGHCAQCAKERDHE